ncbi:MAG: JAB domain-containing protein [Ruminococcus sp.]|jgi:DNA repair protein RadC|nr:JAB domain-containing protein [Ruminococcus sp.]
MAYSHDHGGHRQRMRKKYLENGIDVFADHEALELLLYYAVPQKDTNALAHKLLNHFGSFAGIFDASHSLLKEFGLTDHQITLLKLIPDFSRLYLIDKNKDRPVDINNLCEFFSDKFIGRTTEIVYILLLDSKDKELYSGVLSKGSINSADLPIRKIVELALSYNAASVAIAHNHLSGIALPSKIDLVTTNLIYKSLKLINVRLIDHVIVSEDDSISLAQSAYNIESFVTDE